MPKVQERQAGDQRLLRGNREGRTHSGELPSKYKGRACEVTHGHFSLRGKHNSQYLPLYVQIEKSTSHSNTRELFMCSIIFVYTVVGLLRYTGICLFNLFVCLIVVLVSETDKILLT